MCGPPGEVLVLGEDSPRFRAMAGRGPVLFDRLDSESAERIARRPGGQELTGGYTSFLAMPLVARGAVVGCATFGRAPRGPAHRGPSLPVVQAGVMIAPPSGAGVPWPVPGEDEPRGLRG